MSRPARAIPALALCLAGACASVDPAPAPRDWSAPVDFTALRTEYGARDDFDAVCVDGQPFPELVRQASARAWPEIIATTGVWLDSCPVDIDAHFLRAVALKEVGRFEESELHAEWYKGLVESVLESGDGKTPDSPWVVISVQEKFAMLRVLRASHVDKKPLEGAVEALVVQRQDGTRFVVYFDSSAHLRRLESQPTRSEP